MNPRPFLTALLLLLVSLSFAFSGTALADEWQELHPDSSPGARFGHSLVTIDNDVYLFGGVVVGGDGLPWQDNIYVLGGSDPGLGWIEMPAPAPRPPARAHHSATVVDGKMVIHGGAAGGAPLSDTWVYDPQANTWTQKSSSGPALTHHSAVVSNGEMYLVGGTDSGGMPSAEVWGYDLTSSSWTQGADYPGPFGAAYGAAVFAPDSTIMVGGTTGNDYYVYDPQANTWTQKSSSGTTPPNRVLGASAQVGGSTVEYLFGGEDENVNILNDTWEFDYDTNTWTRKTDMPVALCRSAAATFESKSQSQHVLLFGGLQSDGKPTNRTFVYIPDAEECVPGIAVNKTVFNETAGEWVKETTAELNDTVRFRCVVHNNGTCCNLTNITVTDILSDSLEYRDNATVDGVAAEPTAVSENEYKWEFAGPLAPCEAITIEFDARVIECGNDRNTQNATAWCEEIGAWVYDEDTVWVNCTPPGTPVETATGSGTAYFATDAGTNEDLVAINESTLPAEGKPTLVFPHGFFSFNITGLTPGQTVVVTITLPDNVPVGTEYWKYHASEGGWIPIPMGSDDGDKVITITLVDGGLGDDDGTANGVIVDQGGPGIIPKPDLVITEKYETFVDGGSFNITYKVNNIGGADAGASNTTIYIDGVPLEVPTPAIPRGECHENTVGPFDCPCGVTLNVTVCADNDNVVDESNETNNCKVNVVECPKLPDLVIEEIWTKERWDRCNVYFVVKNISCAPAPKNHYATLLVNDVPIDHKRIRKDLGTGEQYESSFRTTVSCTDDVIRVCADNTKAVDESDETNNCLEYGKP